MTARLKFEEKPEYKRGLAGESTIALWLRRSGYTVLPAYEKIVDNGKGPRVFLPESILVAPDFLSWRGQKVGWIEAKHKTAFTWHRLTHRWTTGIDLSHYKDYLKVADLSPWPVWLLFLHDGDQAKDSPPNSPRGLFGNDLNYLRHHENHRSDKWGPSGMVYWAVGDLQLLSRDVFESCGAERKRIEPEVGSAEWFEAE